MNRKLDQLIAEKVFNCNVKFVNEKYGWRVDYFADKDECNQGIPTDGGYDGYRLKYYSSYIRNAFEIVEKMNTMSPGVSFSLKQDYEGLWNCSFSFSNENCCIIHNSDTAMEAICLAALKAIGIKFEI